MKKLAAILCLSAIAAGAFAQGTVSFLNSSTTLASAGTSATTGAAGSWYYALLTAPSTVTSVVLGDLVKPDWTFTGLQATNLATAGRLNGGANVATLQGWAPGDTRSYAIAGWSVSLGRTWAEVAAQITSGNYVDPNGFIGVSARGMAFAGGGPNSLPQATLFGTAPTAQVMIPVAGLVLQPIPEPTSFALAGLGAAAMLIFRRRK